MKISIKCQIPMELPRTIIPRRVLKSWKRLQDFAIVFYRWNYQQTYSLKEIKRFDKKISRLCHCFFINGITYGFNLSESSRDIETNYKTLPLFYTDGLSLFESFIVLGENYKTLPLKSQIIGGIID
jgi:hypothetical protein